MAACSDDCGASSAPPSDFLYNDDRLFKGRAEPPDVARGTATTMTSRHRRKRAMTPFTCLNCGVGCNEAVFGCACTVECALGYFARIRDITKFKLVCAQYTQVPCYRIGSVRPRPAMFDADKDEPMSFIARIKREHYATNDIRWMIYATQLINNGVAYEDERDDVRRQRDI